MNREPRHALARLLAQLALRRPWLVIACALAVAAVGIGLGARLELQTDLSELLPPSAPSVVALKTLSQRVGGTGNVAIALESPTGPEPLRKYMPELVTALRGGLGGDLLSVRYSRKDLDHYYRKFAAYYVTLDDLSRWERKLATAVAKQNPAYVELDDRAPDPLRELADEVRASRDRLNPHPKAADEDSGLLMTENGHLAVLFVRPASNSLNLGGAGEMLARIQSIVEASAPARYGVRVAGYTGSIPVALAEVAAIRHDIVSTAILVILGVGGIIALYFGGVRELFLMSGAVVVGTAVALGFAELWIGHVNAQTAFLGAIIIGTGINYGIILLDRYRHARVHEPTFEAALEAACAQTLRATSIAAISTALSFGVLAAGQVESFHQFGWIGGIGILACWVATFTLVPAVIVLADRARKARKSAGLGAVSKAFRRLASACERAPRPIAALTAAAVAISVGLAVEARGRAVETNLRNLGTRSARTSGIEALDNRLRKMDDRSSTPSVVATTSRAEARDVCTILKQHFDSVPNDVFRDCYSIDDLLPNDVARRAPLLEKLSKDLELVDEEALSETDRHDLAELRRGLVEPPPSDKELPPEMLEYFTERDGSVGKLAYVESKNDEIEANLYAFTDALRSVHLPSGKIIESSGELVVFADVLRAMRRDASLLTLAAAALVLIALAAVTRRRGSFVRVGLALVIGVAVMVGVAVLLGVKLNFFNFVALPTTFGIGIDYAINIEERIRQSGRSALETALAESGPPVLLASMTSMIGYASLVPADSRALSSFGVLAIIGELACVVVAVVVVPTLWVMSQPRTRA